MKEKLEAPEKEIPVKKNQAVSDWSGSVGNEKFSFKEGDEIPAHLVEAAKRVGKLK